IGGNHQMPVVVGIAIEDDQRQLAAGEHQVRGVVRGGSSGGLAEEAARWPGRFDERHPPGRPEMLHRLNHRARPRGFCCDSYTKSCILAPMASGSAALAERSSLNLTLDPRVWGRGAAGSAIAWHAIGHEFESRRLHQSSSSMARTVAPVYDPQAIEPKWRDAWKKAGLFRVSEDGSKPKFYNLVMFPYPSGPLHMGHFRNYVIGDAFARYKVMRGFNVLNPFGWDAFGLPAENAAIKSGIPPRVSTEGNIAISKHELDLMGVLFAWEREVTTCNDDYYRWTQWLFLKLLERGLAYKQKAAVNWCPKDNTVLANEQIVNGVCWRCGTKPTKIELEQWFFRITAYAQRLLDDLQKLDRWPERVKVMQANWIGRSEGAELDFFVERDGKLRVFTTRPDTVFGATFMVIAPEHELVKRIVTAEQRAAVDAYIERTKTETEIERLSTEHAKTGVFTGAYAVNPFADERIPIWVADYVLATYGTGAIMAVPGHDSRDFEFARTYKLPIRRVISVSADAGSEALDAAFESYQGVLVNSGSFSGLSVKDGIERITAEAERKGIGKRTITYRLRDWLISRQRYWGVPIPIIYCPDHGIVPVPEDQLPVPLPEQVEFRSDGQNPLAHTPAFLNTTARNAASRRDARPTRWTPSSTRPGTSCVTRMPRTSGYRSTRRKRTTGCPSTSTPAASSMPSCTCSTRAS